MKKLNLSIVSIVLLIAGMYNIHAATAANDMDAGMALFKKQDYKHAIVHFVQALKTNPKDSNVLYYEAVTYHQLKELDSAKAAYRKVLQDFPDTPAAKNSHLALMYIDPAYARSYQQQMAQKNRQPKASSDIPVVDSTRRAEGSNTTSSDLNNLPDQARVPYQKEGQNLVVTAYLNGRPIDMFFDSGAEGVVIRKSVLESLGIKPPSGQHSSMSYGIGDGGAQRTWIAKVTLKVGQIERTNFSLHVQEDPAGGGGPTHPLLGQTFFRDFSYTLDPAPDGSRGTILFQKKNPSRAFSSNDSSVISFTNLGKEILVPVEINGRKIMMIFDTGAEICSFTRGQFASLGMAIPDDAQRGLDQGIAGLTASARFTVPRMQLGQVIKTDVNVSVTDNSSIPYPLLGNSFLQGLRIDIDNEAHLMRVRR